MTDEEKQLLLKDLCARLAYRNTKCYNRNTEEDFTLSDVSDTDTDYPTFDYGYCDIEYIQPYLRPMSSMTEKEMSELRQWGCLCMTPDDFVEDIGVYGAIHSIPVIDYLNSIHVDYRGLIEKGLAIDCTNLNIY